MTKEPRNAIDPVFGRIDRIGRIHVGNFRNHVTGHEAELEVFEEPGQHSPQEEPSQSRWNVSVGYFPKENELGWKFHLKPGHHLTSAEAAEHGTEFMRRLGFAKFEGRPTKIISPIIATPRPASFHGTLDVEFHQ